MPNCGCHIQLTVFHPCKNPTSMLTKCICPFSTLRLLPINQITKTAKYGPNSINQFHLESTKIVAGVSTYLVKSERFPQSEDIIILLRHHSQLSYLECLALIVKATKHYVTDLNSVTACFVNFYLFCYCRASASTGEIMELLFRGTP